MKSIILIPAIALAIGLAGCSPKGAVEPSSSPPGEVTSSSPAAPAPAPPADTATAAQKNAQRQAESYLKHQAFSRTGLIKQLEFEKYATEDATWGVDHVTVDWMEQAAKSAKSYLEHQAFSHDGLVKQLEFEGYTPEEAEHGVTAAGL